MDNDIRCYGTGTCIINSEGVCWCGQVWDGEKMCMPKLICESTDTTHDDEAKSTRENETPPSSFV